MSILGIERSSTNPVDVYDHAINLIDSTQEPSRNEPSIEDAAHSSSATDDAPDQPVTRQPTRTHLRKQLAQRKYAKWQEDKEAEIAAEPNQDDTIDPKKLSKTDTLRSGRLRDKIPFRNKKIAARSSFEEPTFIDVLYENQRGWWACGIPLYSSNSLLQFDAAAWQTSTFRDSPVDITNAQVPDPSWEWAWKRWYVDMSYDVDEEGWQYSFSFGTQFAWHGNHPWFHSYVRRRRWLRKRAKKGYQSKTHGTMKEAHHLNPDYFTIHPTLRPSRDTSTERDTTRQTSFNDAVVAASDTNDSVEEIVDIAALLAALKRAIVDREKIGAVKAFLDQGGDEIYYLAESMPVILNDFVHQTSRRQLHHVLLESLEAAKDEQERCKNDDERSSEAKRRVDNILKAIRAGGVHENDLEYWSDLRSQQDSEEAGPPNGSQDLDATQTVSSLERTPDITSQGQDRGDVQDEIKGLPEGTDLFEEPHIGMGGMNEDEEEEVVDSSPHVEKGKGRE